MTGFLKILAIFFILTYSADAKIWLPKIFGSHMVLQQASPAKIWGEAKPGAEINITIADQTVSAETDPKGKWLCELTAMQAGGPHTMRISDGTDTVQFDDILIGEVWICSGQSNMDWPLSRVQNAGQELAAAHYPGIRLFKVERSADEHPQKDIKAGQWAPCTPQTSENISAAGYFFARELHQKLGVPIGIIHTAWGGSRAEAWTEYSFLKIEPALLPLVANFESVLNLSPAEREAQLAEFNAWKNERRYIDPGSRAKYLGWTDPEFDDHQWAIMHLPGLWEAQGLDMDGSVWFRRSVIIPDHWREKDLILKFSFIDDFDICFFNGREIGKTTRESKQASQATRSYSIPAELVRPGEVNSLAVRIFDEYRRGGIGGDSADFYLAPASGNSGDYLYLAGSWRYKIEHQLLPQSNGGPAEPIFPGNRHALANLYNGMIAPLVPFSIRGVIWYQGESNAERAEEYKTLFPAMINSWRQHWQHGVFPFYWVQLANYKKIQIRPSEGGWAFIREAQTSALRLKYTGMAVITDVGDAGDIHPRDKKTVGQRLALIARAKTYGENITYSGPFYREMKLEGTKIRIIFDHTAQGLITPGNEPLRGFAIRSTADEWLWATAEIDGNDVIVSNDSLQNPVAVRYNWADNPIGNLYNTAGLPANSFRTDTDIE